MPMVTCPCCHGAKRLLVFEPADDGENDVIATRPECCHCQGKGEVPAEVEEIEMP